MHRSRRARRVAGAVAALVAVTVSLSLPIRALDPTTVPNAVAYLATQQIAGTDPATGSGAWDTDPAFAFVTFDAVLAIAEAAQTGTTWDAAAALDAVTSFVNADGTSPIPYLDLAGAAIVGPGAAGKTIVMLAAPLGLPLDAYDPAGDGNPVDLVGLVGAPAPNGSYDTDAFFNNTLFAALGTHVAGGTIVPATVSYVQGCQQPGGGWAFDCSDATDPEIDTTALALQVLVAGGVSPTDPSIVNGLAYIASQLQPGGFWPAFDGAPSVESSSRAMLAITAAGFDVNTSCWRDTVAPASAGQPFVPADDAVESFVQPDGSIAGPGAFSVAWATAQSVSGLLRSWLPVAVGPAQACAAPVDPVVPVAPIVPGAGVTPRFTG